MVRISREQRSDFLASLWLKRQLRLRLRLRLRQLLCDEQRAAAAAVHWLTYQRIAIEDEKTSWKLRLTDKPEEEDASNEAEKQSRRGNEKEEERAMKRRAVGRPGPEQMKQMAGLNRGWGLAGVAAACGS